MASLIVRTARSLRYRGLRRSAVVAARLAGFRLAHGRSVRAPSAIDLELNVDTDQPLTLEGRNIHLGAGIGYGPAAPMVFKRMMAHIPVASARFCFIDIGCGKGRALILASEYPFRCIRGVEADFALYQTALENLARCRAHRQVCRDIELVCGDAQTWEWPVMPSVFFCNDPLFPHAMRELADRVRASLAAAPRPAYVIHLGDIGRDAWETAGDFEMLTAANDDRTYRWRGWPLPYDIAGLGHGTQPRAISVRESG